MLLITMIYTASHDGVLGHNKTIPWNESADLERIRAATAHKTLIMGRHTWEAQPIKVGSCNVIVLSTQPLFGQLVQRATSLENGLDIARQNQVEEVVIVGGAMLFQEAMNLCHVIYKSTLLIEVKGNVHAPQIPAARFKLIWVRNIHGSPSYSYQTFVTNELVSHKLTADFGLIIRC